MTASEINMCECHESVPLRITLTAPKHAVKQFKRN